MSFGSPERLLVLLLLPAVAAAYSFSRRLRKRRTAALAVRGLVTMEAAHRQRRRPHLPFALFIAALALLGVAFARPMATVRTPRRQATVILTMDVSNSMGAADVKPSRIGAAELAAREFIREQPSGVRIGVVAFGAGAVIVQPPTFAHADALRAINRLSLGGGTSLAAGILTSLDAIAGKTLIINKASLSQDNSAEVNIGYYGGATIVLFSDGEDTSQTDPVTMARVASSAGVRIQTIGVGTVAGTTVKVDGFSVATALDPQTLQSVATVTNGSYHLFDDQAALKAVSRSINLHFATVTQNTEITGLFTAAAAVFLVVGALVSVRWSGRVV
ncbi:MAG TPA: VWA domain-containing protein [Acidimicrobiales bacterium]|nr:VWA domain-containing protein [Acidimicrobiales bacterium]